MVPLQHRTEVLMAGMAGCGPEGGASGPAHMARAYHEALGVSFQSADPQKYLDALLYRLTLAWGTEITSFSLTPDAAAVSFAICDLVSREPAKTGTRKYAGTQPGAKATPKKQQQNEKLNSMAVDEDVKGSGTQVGCAAGVGAEEDEEVRPEMPHKEPSYKNARWLRKRPGAPRWMQKICRLLEDFMEADETEAETDMGAVVSEFWRIVPNLERMP